MTFIIFCDTLFEQIGGNIMNEISYFKELNNYEVLADKISDEELNNYFLDMKNGDYSAREKIIEHNLSFVIYEVNSNFLILYVIKTI